MMTSSSETPSLLLLGCVKLKRDEAAPAKDLYVSPLFAKRRRYAEKIGAPWVIVSARLPGFIRVDEVIEPYDRVMTKLSAAERREWVEEATEAAREILAELELDDGGIVEVHAGRAYVDVVIKAIGAVRPDLKIRTPLSGLRMGEQLRWYNEH